MQELPPVILILTAIVTLLLPGCSDTSEPAASNAAEWTTRLPAREAELDRFKKAIRAKYDMKERAFRDNDPEPILSRFYSENVISTDPEGNTKIGRAELRPVYDEVIGSLVRIESFNSFVNGEAGWDWVNFHVSFPPEANLTRSHSRCCFSGSV